MRQDFEDVVKRHFDAPEPCGAGKVMPLDEAVRRAVRPGMTLHTGITHVFSYAAINEIIRQFWKKDPGLVGVDASDPRWRFLNEHVRAGAHAPESRFLVMELTAAPR